MVLLENPSVIRAIKRGGAFGGEFSRHVATGMFSRNPDAIADAIELTRVEEFAPRTWLIRLPIVNAVLFETDEGLVLVDTGMAPAGPAVLKAIRSVSKKPLHTVIYTHAHVDHAYGTWALLEAGETPAIIAQERAVKRFERYLRTRGSISKYMDQPLDTLPASREDIAWPTRTFKDRLELIIGGETFVLQHHKGETDDQLYVWVPSRKTLAIADYYQGFLPNAGNGKRAQRYVEEWIVALQEMAALEPAILLPAHGQGIAEPELIKENLQVLAEALQSIFDQTIAGLNAGMRKDQVFEAVELPDHLANHPSLKVQYVSAKDISKMIIKRYTGWWDDIPSRWSPAPLEVEAREIVRLSGGITPLLSRTRELIEIDIQLACHLVDWAYLAEPENPAVQEMVIEVYRERIVDPASNTQEMLTYVNQMVDARSRQLAAEEADASSH
ncbi:MAG: MBL fold metallo-hydrolase [Deltaproteobacteria bacterium]|nr:MBL fold metallo-hydrolase [Deltaproteobacteria bacterium]